MKFRGERDQFSVYLGDTRLIAHSLSLTALAS
jgi:hypothetical protein